MSVCDTTSPAGREKERNRSPGNSGPLNFPEPSHVNFAGKCGIVGRESDSFCMNWRVFLCRSLFMRTLLIPAR